jgi:hypothetical protein
VKQDDFFKSSAYVAEVEALYHRRSHDRDTTKGGHADAIPIAAELKPFLEAAISASPSELVFPRPDGRMMARGIQLEQILRRALRQRRS